MLTANEIALQTLREHCSPEQTAALDARQPLEVIAPSGGRYRLHLQDAGTWVDWNGGRAVVLTRGIARLPPADLALLAKLLIENAETSWMVASRYCGTVWVLS